MCIIIPIAANTIGDIARNIIITHLFLLRVEYRQYKPLQAVNIEGLVCDIISIISPSREIRFFAIAQDM